METTGLKEEDSSVEIYMENILTEVARHKKKKKKNKHMQETNRTAQVRAQTTETKRTGINDKVWKLCIYIETLTTIRSPNSLSVPLPTATCGSHAAHMLLLIKSYC